MSSEESRPSEPRAAQTAQIFWPQPGQPGRSNGTQPIDSSLPQELFVKILREVYALILRDSPHSEWRTNWTSPYQLVCRCWRDVIHSTPWFWSQGIMVSRSPEWLELCLARCAGSPATIYGFSPHSPSATFATLGHYAPSIGACHIQSDSETSCSDGLSSLLSASMPSLETLSISAYEDAVDAVVSVTPDLLPRLTTLNLAHCPAPRDTTVYASLRNLTLHQSPWQISYADFLEAIGQCNELESLHLDAVLLDQFLGAVTGSTVSRPRRRTPVVLPRLREAGLCGMREVIIDLLGTLHAPSFALIQAVTFINPTDLAPHLSQMLAPDLQLRHTFLRCPTSVSIKCRNDDFEVLLGGETGQQLFLGIYCNGEEATWSMCLEPNIVAAMDRFSFEQIDTLQIDGNYEGPADVWRRTFQSCRNLRTLHLKGWGALDSVWQGLWDATPSSQPENGVVCCPFLEEISVNEDWYGMPFIATPALSETIRRTLHARADQYGIRLRKRKMSLGCAGEPRDDTAGLRDVFMKDLRALVEELDLSVRDHFSVQTIM